MSTKQQIQQERKRHHDALEQLARSLGVTDKTGLQLWRKLRQIEYRTRRAAEQYCNGVIDSEAMDKAADIATIEVSRVFGNKTPPHFHVNRDPRGYALKLLSNEDGSKAATPFALHQDWGRNQILAPEID